MSLPPAGEPARWQALFADLEAQLAAQESLDVASEVAERTRRERALIPFAARLAAHLAGPITVELVTGARLVGVLEDLGEDWILLVVESAPGSARRTRHLLPAAALTGLLDPPARAKEARTARRFGLGSALRVLSRDRATVTVEDLSGRLCTGTIDAVGQDYLELAEHALGEWRRSSAVQGRRLTPFAALVSVRSAG